LSLETLSSTGLWQSTRTDTLLVDFQNFLLQVRRVAACGWPAWPAANSETCGVSSAALPGLLLRRGGACV